MLHNLNALFYLIIQEVLDSVKNVMRNIVQVMDRVIQFLSDWKDPNDPDNVMHYKELDIVISKIPSYKLKGNFNYTWGGAVVNGSSDIFGSEEHDCVENKVRSMVMTFCFRKGNKFIFKKKSCAFDLIYPYHSQSAFFLHVIIYP